MQYKGINIKMFQAKSGDCFLSEFVKAEFRILIDGGFVDTYRRQLRSYLQQISKELVSKKFTLLRSQGIPIDS